MLSFFITLWWKRVLPEIVFPVQDPLDQHLYGDLGVFLVEIVQVYRHLIHHLSDPTVGVHEGHLRGDRRYPDVLFLVLVVQPLELVEHGRRREDVGYADVILHLLALHRREERVRAKEA